MQFPESWLREFCNPPLSTAQLAETLTMGGLEVEDMKPAAPPFKGVVVGEIKHAEQHPNADRLRVCQVDVGQPVLLNIVCGAPNARVGIKVPCALVGAELPPSGVDGAGGQAFVIKLGQLRGVESQGMLCSAHELQLSDEQGGLLELAQNAAVGQDIRQLLALDDTVFTLKLTPNLAHCLSVYGVARELSALTGAPLKTPTMATVAAQHSVKLAVEIAAPDLCGRFSGRVIQGVNPQATPPAWMLQRLARCGQRSVSALVDISNYVMFECGQPTHIFDLDKIHGSLQVRWGRAGESLALLNGSTAVVDEKVGVIADDAQLESLAGIMGGAASAVSDSTQNIYLEAAFWWPKAIAGRSRRFNFSTDAGHRFERGVDPSQTVLQIERITQLILDICGGQPGPVDDQIRQLPAQNPVTLRVARAAKVIGMPLTPDQCLTAFQRLALPAQVIPGDPAQTIAVTPPPHRFDLQIEEDLIEEVVRLIGYEHLPTTAPLAPIAPLLRTESQRGPFAVRRVLAALGYQETINFSFVDARWERELAGNANPIRLLNPIASQMSVMRSSLLGSLLHVLKFNTDRKAHRVRVFELGHVFLRNTLVQNTDTTVEGFDQPMRVAGLAYGPAQELQWGAQERTVDFFDVKGDLQALLAPLCAEFLPDAHPAMHPGRCAKVLLQGREIGHVGELHPQWRQAYDLPQAPMLFELALDAVLKRDLPRFQPVPKHQAALRDIAVIVAEPVTHAALMAAIECADTAGLLRSASLFDVYRPQQGTAGLSEGEKSLAVRLCLHSDEATLTEAQIDAAVAAVVEQLQTQLAARLRA
ncbi:MAG: phenylalanine--tRNA ligase subunit beta [Burkholderiaceae bacterium]